VKRRIWLLAMFSVVILSGTAAWADADFYVIAGGGSPVGTKISSLPYTITAPGFYYLSGNLSTTGQMGIWVNANNVTIDLMGFTLTGPGNNSDDLPNGIHIPGRHNVEIRNGTVCNFWHGISDGGGRDGSNHRVIGIRAQGNGFGIYFGGEGILIQNCNASNNTVGDGIYLYSSGILIGNVACKNKGYGFNLQYDGGKIVDRNTAWSNDGGNYSHTFIDGWGVNGGTP
jgi:hypothetical protein